MNILGVVIIKNRKQGFAILNERILKLIEPDLEDKVIKLINDAIIIKAKNKIDLEYIIAHPGEEEKDPHYLNWLHATTKLIKYLNDQIRYLIKSGDWTPMSDALEGYAELISILAHPTKAGALDQVKGIFYKKNSDIIPIIDSRDLPNTWGKDQE